MCRHCRQYTLVSCITRIKCCYWLVSISSTSMFTVHVIPTHLRTGRGGAMMGRAVRPLDAALCNCPRSSHIHPQGLCHPSWCLCWSPLHCHLSNMHQGTSGSTAIALCIRHHHLSSDESGRGKAGHGEHRNIAHMKHQHLRFMKIINY